MGSPHAGHGMPTAWLSREGAQLALEIGPILLKELKKDEFPLMFNILETICNNKKLIINW